MIAAIETAILTRLKAAEAGVPLGYDWRLLETYPADWDAYFKNKTQINAPAAWVTFAGFERIAKSNEGPIGTAAIGVVVAARNLRNETATRHGAEAGGKVEPGSYQLMLDAIGVLVDQDFDLDITGLKLIETRQVDAAGVAALRQMSVFALRFQTDVTIPALPFDDVAADPFERFHANWDIAPFGGVDSDPTTPGVQLPADATADATDHMELPQ